MSPTYYHMHLVLDVEDFAAEDLDAGNDSLLDPAEVADRLLSAWGEYAYPAKIVKAEWLP